MDDELKRVIEAILFAAGKKIELERIAKLCGRSESEVLVVLREWKSRLDDEKSPTMLVEDGSGWKLTVREQYIPVIKRIVTKTELPKSILETLAIVAYKAPVLQSKVIKLRTNKAYDHLNYLESLQLIVREKSGRTKLIKLTSKFFEYFDIDSSQLKKKFGNAKDVEMAIETKEREIEESESQQRKQTSENLEKPQIVVGGEPLETYNASVDLEPSLPLGLEIAEDKVGELEVYKVEEEKRPVSKKHHKKKSHNVGSSGDVVDEFVEEKEVEEIEPRNSQGVEKEEVFGDVIFEKKKPSKKDSEKKIETEVEKGKEMESEDELVEVETEKLVERISPESVSKEAQIRAQKLKSKEGKGLFQKGVPRIVEQKIEERIQKLMRGEDDESSGGKGSNSSSGEGGEESRGDEGK